MIPPGEKIIEKKICRISGQEFFVTDKDLEFYDKISPVFSGKKYAIPGPTLCPDERMRRRLLWRNEYKIYKRKCDGTGKDIISVFRPDAPFPVYDADYWWGDAWSGYDHALDFDFSKAFFPQFQTLFHRVPQISRSVIQNQNSDYVNQAGWNKDCYLLFEGSNNEKCYFSHCLNNSKTSMDMLYSMKCELCFECVDCTGCFNTFFSQNCTNCIDSYFLKNCIGCKNCFWCTNLSHKEYYFLNKSYSKQEYEEKKKWANIKDVTELQKVKWYFLKQAQNMPVKYYEGHKNENVSGDYLQECFNCHTCFDLFHCRDSRYCAYFQNGKSLYDVNVFGADKGGELCLECHEVGDGVYGLAFCDQSFNGLKNSFYSKMCANNGENIFGCIGLKKAKNCVLNKSYSTQEYEILCWKIVDHMRWTGEWGEFFPHELSPFGYNETIAQEYFPLNETQAKEKGWNWHNEESKWSSTNSYTPLPISQYDERIVGYEWAQKNIDELLGAIVICEITGKPFKLIKQELLFYVQNGIPLPTKHPDQRHKERMALRNPREIYERNCAECAKSITTTYSPARPEKVFCEECYHKLVY
jgi:hypothetical protein